MKKISAFLVLTGMFTIVQVTSQNPPDISAMDYDTLIVNSGNNYLIIPDVSDGDGIDQSIDFTVTSSDDDILVIENVHYTAGDNLAIVDVLVKDKTGSVTIDIEATDEDGKATGTIEVHVDNYKKHGINFSIHDIVFWQEIDPLNEPSIFDTVVNKSEGPYDMVNWDKIPHTVGAGCNSDVCVGHDFLTCMLKGFLIPPADGEYTFYMRGADDRALWLSENRNHADADVIIYQGNQDVGTMVDDQDKASDPLYLEGGSVYAIRGVQWMIHTYYGGMMWEGPGIEKDYIDGQYLKYLYDTVFPGAPSDIRVLNTGTTDMRIAWSEAVDDQKVEGYRVYVNGREVTGQLIVDTVYVIKELIPGTDYSIAVSAVDEMGNESFLSDIINKSTYNDDDIPPPVPTGIAADIITGTAVQVSWTPVVDKESETRGYNVFLDGELYNTAGLIDHNQVIIKVLDPKTEIGIAVQAVDAAYNESGLSEVLSVTTSGFDPLGPGLGVKKARYEISLQNISWNDGIGINSDFRDESSIAGRTREIIEEFKPGIVRWGTLTANPISFESVVGSDATALTIADWMNFTNDLGVYCGFTCGVQDGLDWRTEPGTFANFLEYLGGPSSSTWGAVRAEEGYEEPLLPQCKGLIFEFGNEVWGGNSHDAQIGEGDLKDYGQWCREMAIIMKNSPYWDEEKIKLVYSSRYVNPEDDWRFDTRNVLNGDTGEVDWMAITGYLHGNLNYDPEIPAWNNELDFYKTITEHSFAHNVEGLDLTMQLMISITGEIKPTYFYESNLTTPSYNGRLGQAVIMLDYMASAMEHGGAIPTVFHLTGGQWRITEPENDYRKLPLFYNAQFFNSYCTGHILKSELVTNNVLYNADGEAIEGFDPVGCHAYNQGENYSILLCSRDFENDYLVQLDLPDDMVFQSMGIKYTITGDGFSTKETIIDTTDIGMKDSLIINVPKYSVVYIIFNGDDPGFEQLPLAHFPLDKPDSIAIMPREEFDVLDEVREQVIFDAIYYPEDKEFWPPFWETLSNDLQASASRYNSGNSYRIKAPSACDIEGNIIIKVSAAGYDGINDTYTVPINIVCENDVQDLKGQGENLLYPNPVQDMLYVQMKINEHVEMVITDIHGKTLKRGHLSGHGSEINVKDLKEGIYILRLETREKAYNLKFIKE